MIWTTIRAGTATLMLFAGLLSAEAAAPEQTHWAYVKPIRPELPQVKSAAWPRNGIDHFILARLEKEGLNPSSEAEKAMLIRRLALDLTGLPPTVSEVDQFIADESPDAWDKAVERLLSSPHYGEHWARMWLDLARYADSHGYEKDPGRQMWLYRDWVIGALNQNMKFDQFTIEQIAGDLLPNATVQQKIASGFHRNTMFNTEGGVDKEEARVETIVDRVNTTASIWLGTTLGCAQCHNHKYDPFTMKDYYQFFAFFNTVDEPQLDVPSPEQAAGREKNKSELARLEKIMKTQTPELDASQAAWEYKMADEAVHWTVLDPAGFMSAGGATLTKLEDKSLLASGTNPTNDSYTVVAHTDLKMLTGLRLEVLPDDSLPKKGLGRHANGSFVLSRLEVKAAPKAGPKGAVQLIFKSAGADYTQKDHSVTNLIDGKEGAGWAVDAGKDGFRIERYAVFGTDQPVGFENGTTLTVILKHDSKFAEANLGRFRLSVTPNDHPVPETILPAATLKVLSVAPRDRTPKQKEDLSAHYRSIAPELKPTREALAQQKKIEEQLKKEIPTTLVMKEQEKPRDTHIHVRGNFLNKGDKVSQGVPAMLQPWPEDAPLNRLSLAKWLVDSNNPLTARVIVNRIWFEYFGRGLVETVEDFGTQGTPPSHPELLDWLATELMRLGWDVKALHRLIVTSGTYRQSSRATPDLLERDPANRFYARGPRFRAPAETVRDVILAASGLLKTRIGGPSVYPHQPDGIWTQIYGDEKWTISKGEDKYRRGLYTYWKRTSPYPAFMSFDAPSREYACTRRPRTNTPLQALTTLNDPAFVEAAQVLARRITTGVGPDPVKRARFAFRSCVAREPKPKELDRLLALYQDELARFKTDVKAAEVMAFGAEGKAPEGFDVCELAAWTVVANVLLNLDETITKG
ncbi:MAG: DUF1553 domain-containing protein [Verrucomicrobia bacterium]|nr:DUF1553 domain-containing protein [Verrucomicrobiota bacterium]